MSNIEYHKIGNEDKLKMLNKVIVDIENKRDYMRKDDFIRLDSDAQTQFLNDLKKDIKTKDELNNEINKLVSYAPDLSDKLYLTEVIDIEKPKFESNNLILSPVGSGKTTLITERLIENKEQTVLLLVSTESLKESLAPKNNKTRAEYGNRMFTSSNKEVFGDKKYKIHVMSYAEFGERIYVNNDFLIENKVTKVFCDEIHSLPDYISFGGNRNAGLLHAQRLLFSKIEGIQVFYFTATEANIMKANEKRKGTLDNVKIFNYLEYPNIMRYMPKAIREINNIQQIRQYLRDRKVGFKYYNYKGMAFSKKISSLKVIEEIVKEEGYNPLVIWSINNEEYEMTKEQLRARDELIATNKIPKPYNFIIFNSSLQEGWDLKDNSVKLAVMNTTNETEYIQALGRLRRDVDLLIYRSRNKKIDIKASDLDIPEKFLSKPLSTDDKKDLALELGLINAQGKPVGWKVIRKLIDDGNIYIESEAQKTVEGSRLKFSTIIKK